MTSSTFRKCLNISPYLSIDYINFPQSWYVSNRFNITRYLYNIKYLFPISFAKYIPNPNPNPAASSGQQNRCVIALFKYLPSESFNAGSPLENESLLHETIVNCSMEAHCFSVEIRLFSVEISYM